MLRLQFSLRSLLVLTALIGIGIAVYRWPWVVTKIEAQSDLNVYFGTFGRSNEVLVCREGRWESNWLAPMVLDSSFPATDEHRTTTIYRRGWNGAHLKNGREEVHVRNGDHWRLLIHRDYVDGDLRRLKIYDNGGAAKHSEGRLNGEPHGSFRGLHSFYKPAAGHYVRGKKVGIWSSSYRLLGEKIDLQQSFDNNRVHGEWVWKTPQGRVLQTALFDQGRLVEWNADPVQPALQTLLQQSSLPGETRSRWLQPAQELFDAQSKEGDFVLWNSRGKDRGFIWSAGHAPYQFADFPFLRLDQLALPSQRPAIEELLEKALVHSQTLTLRYGVVILVPISAEELLNWDQTGLQNVAFAADSPQQAAWLEKVDQQLPYLADPEQACHQLFRNTPIQIDTYSFRPEPALDRANSPPLNVYRRLQMPTGMRFQRPRRDILGFILHIQGWSCEPWGNALQIRPRAPKVAE